jgi:hypothetical protein
MTDLTQFGTSGGTGRLSRSREMHEDAMRERKNNGNKGNQRPVTGSVPGWLYGMAIGFVTWFALAVWLFAGAGTTDYLLFIVSGFIFVVMFLQFILSRVRRDEPPAKADESSHFSDRRKWDLETFQSRISFNQAAVQILLPLAAAALGMTAIGIVMQITEHAGT